ncbi:nicotinate phosphoribosyltransferase [Flavobacterium tistrianum]|nr:nicotinate phosphoribosyltransferase [Flavobacterium tistrianum]
MKKIYKAPEEIPLQIDLKTIFLAGSIEMDKAVDWQKKCEELLQDQFVVFNPRRNEWDSSWSQTIENIHFKEQVDWELDALEKADIIIMYFADNTMSPISLLEFGLYAQSNKMKVVVEENFWRKGNIDIVCERYSVQQFKTLEELIQNLLNRKYMNPLLLTDGYKVDHRRQYPDGTTLVYSNWTPRKSRLEEVDEVVFFGLQYFIKKYIIHDFEEYFFKKSKEEVVAKYARRINNYLGENQVGTKHIEDLHDLGYIPMVFKALPEGASVPLRVPMFTMYNTIPEFFWLTNYFETLLSAVIWLPCNSATIAKEYRKVLDKYADQTSSVPEFVDWQAHDFSMRGMGGIEAALTSAAGHLLSFKGSDTIPAIDFLEEYYKANSDQELVAGSVAATEHSVMCMGTTEGEYETFKRLITEVYPKGIVSIVSDTWDLWKVLTDYLPRLREDIVSREGKVVIRPDSGDPVDIICGNPNGKTEQEKKGVIELLWDVFGGTTNAKGFKELVPQIGAIYGDSITVARATQICERLKEKGFASTNVVLGIGSFTYQYNTRDTFGFAMKATYGEVNGEGRAIFKDPITDDGTKKSAKGLMKIDLIDGKYHLTDNVSWEEEKQGELKEVFRDGKLLIDQSLSEIRTRVKNEVSVEA